MENQVKIGKNRANVNDTTLPGFLSTCLTQMGFVENYPWLNLLIIVNFSAFFVLGHTEGASQNVRKFKFSSNSLI